MASQSPLIVVVGPTASGKSELGIKLAQKFNGEIICADSRTVYKYLDIGTAKPTIEDCQRVPHRLLDIVSPDEPFTAADFKVRANEAIGSISEKQRLPIMVGGSGLYIDAVLYDYKFAKERSPRDEVNPRHVSRSVRTEKAPLRKNTLIVGLNPGREVLKERISNRVDAMINAGLIDEVEKILQDYPSSKALLAPGYKAFSSYIAGEIDMQQAKNVFVRNDNQLAKRQMTWFKRNKSIHWVTSQRQAMDLIESFLHK